METFQRSVSSNAAGQPGSNKQDIPLGNNFRLEQPLNDRVIYSSNLDDGTIWTAPLSPISITLAVLLGFIILFLVLGRQQRLDAEADKTDYPEYEHDGDAHQD